MCRSIKRLREGSDVADDDEIRAAALQFVRKISGYRQPSPANAPAFDSAVDQVTVISQRLLREITAKRRGSGKSGAS